MIIKNKHWYYILGFGFALIILTKKVEMSNFLNFILSIIGIIAIIYGFILKSKFKKENKE